MENGKLAMLEPHIVTGISHAVLASQLQPMQQEHRHDNDD
jgi:hypothetical protein